MNPTQDNNWRTTQNTNAPHVGTSFVGASTIGAREYFAGVALQSLLAVNPPSSAGAQNLTDIAGMAVQYADALVSRLNTVSGISKSA